MDRVSKIKLLIESARYDLCGDCFLSKEVRRIKDLYHTRWIYPELLPDGRRVRLLKVLLSNYCENDCAYCSISKFMDVRRVSFTSEELAEIFVNLYQRGLVNGLFLSSGVKGNPERTMRELIDTVWLLRKKYHFKGYVHLKILPGVSLQTVEEAVRLASRVSVNLEVPNDAYLRKVSSKKELANDLLEKLNRISIIKESQRDILKDGFTTQFVVGVAEETDFEILQTVDRLYRKLRLSRAYYSAFQPIPKTPLQNKPPTNLVREVRLYQADYLIRKYGFTLSELNFDIRGFLSLTKDPKELWALQHPEFFPVELTKADYFKLLRVPGIGPRTARWILKKRKALSTYQILNALKFYPNLRKALPYIAIKGKKLGKSALQGELFLGETQEV
ncbi:MAG: putative DNA modification/repair radical SAM protein [bacterium]|nr:putative DNA modification/repair radical SAM protein [bacterium]